MNGSQMASEARERLDRFLGIFSPRFPKPALGFLGQMLYGLPAAKDIKLSCIGRALDEEIALKKTEARLSRNLAREGLTEAVLEGVALAAGQHIGKDTPIVVAPTDIRKLYARKMPCRDRIRDGSKGALGNGYMKLFNHFQNNALRFIVRPIGNRHLLWHNRPILAEVYRIEYGVLDVRLPERPGERLRLVVVKGFGEKPMLRLTNLALTDSRASLWQVVEGYLSRWRIEDAIRYIRPHDYAIADGLATRFRRFGKWHGRQLADAASETSRQLELPLFGSG